MKINLKQLLIFLLAFFPLLSLANTALNPADLWTTQKNDARPVLLQNTKLQLQAQTLHQHDAKLNYLIIARYPQISANPLSAGAAHFNKLIQDFIDQQMEAFKQDIRANAANPAPANILSYLRINYEMADMASQSQHTAYTSIRFSIDSFERGMAHPSHQTQIFNFDLAQNKPLALPDLFKPNTDYLAVIANYCTQQLLAKKLPAEMVKTGAAAKPDNYKNWNITLSGLLITFGEAQVAPRFFGPQEILVPKDVLKNIVTQQTACTLSIVRCDKT
jgi:hypothetical protein